MRIQRQVKNAIKDRSLRIYRPPEGLDGHGQRDPEQDTLVAENVPASVRVMRGQELDVARQIFPIASHEIRFFADPRWKLTEKDYLIDQEAGRRFEIGSLDNPFLMANNELVAVAGEVKHG